MKEKWYQMKDISDIAAYQDMLRWRLRWEEVGISEQNASDQGTHYMRRAIQVSPPEFLLVFFLEITPDIFQIVAAVKYPRDELPQAYVITTWIYEDIIPRERKLHRSNPNHCCHLEVCLSDLLINAVPVNEEEIDEDIEHTMWICEGEVAKLRRKWAKKRVKQ